MTTCQLKDLVVPTLLIEGTSTDTNEYATRLLCKNFCKEVSAGDPDNCFCINCRRIKQHQHPYLLWICPEKDYTVDEVDVVFDKVRLALEDHEQFFFVLEKAQTLNPATANRLLKVFEEPPRGYVFILLTTNKNAILPTILSRSYIMPIGETSQQKTDAAKVIDLHPIMEYLAIPSKLDDPVGFEQELKKNKQSEKEAVQLCFDLLEYLTQKLAQNPSDGAWYIAAIETVKNHLHTPPGSGSADFFLKRLFLHMPQP